MRWFECLLIIIGIAMDLFATMECQGSLLSKIKKTQLAKICVIISLFELGALYIGQYLSTLLYKKNPVSNEALLGEIVAIIIFFGLAIRLAVKAIRNEMIQERREDNIKLARLIRGALGTVLYTVLTGIAFGFIGTSVVVILIMVVALTVVVICAGLYTGYLMGFEHKTKAYVIGAILLAIAGIDIIIRCANQIY